MVTSWQRTSKGGTGVVSQLYKNVVVRCQGIRYQYPFRCTRFTILILLKFGAAIDII
jgi:hypothetical protein